MKVTWSVVNDPTNWNVEDGESIKFATPEDAKRAEKLFNEVQNAANCLGKPGQYWYDAFQIAEGLRADAERRVDELKSLRPEAGGMAMAMQGAPTIGDHVVSALRDLAAMYSHAWDREDGALVMMGSSVQYFERCHAKAQRALEMVDKPRPQVQR